MIPQEIERRARDVLLVYTSYRQSIQFALGSTIAVGDISNRAVKTLRRNLSETCDAHQRSLKSSFDQAHDYVTTASQAATSDSLSTSVTEYLNELVEVSRDNIFSQMEKDANQAILSFRQFIASVYLKMNTQGLTKRSVIASERDRAFSQFSTRRRDSMGRSWDSERFVITELRSVLYQVFNGHVLYAVTLHGDEKIRYSRPGHSLDGEVFAVSDFQERRKKLLHPNAKAVILRLEI